MKYGKNQCKAGRLNKTQGCLLRCTEVVLSLAYVGLAFANAYNYYHVMYKIFNGEWKDGGDIFEDTTYLRFDVIITISNMFLILIFLTCIFLIWRFF